MNKFKKRKYFLLSLSCLFSISMNAKEQIKYKHNNKIECEKTSSKIVEFSKNLKMKVKENPIKIVLGVLVSTKIINELSFSKISDEDRAKFEKWMKNPEIIYSNSETIKNRFFDIFDSSIRRLESTFKKFLKTKKGTCWEIALSTSYYLLYTNPEVENYIILVKTSPFTCHTFNCYFDKNNILHIIDLFERKTDRQIDSMNELQNYGYIDHDCKNWYVFSPVKDGFVDHFKQLGWKNICKFYSEDKLGLIIIENGKIKRNNKVSWNFNPFKFPTFG